MPRLRLPFGEGLAWCQRIRLASVLPEMPQRGAREYSQTRALDGQNQEHCAFGSGRLLRFGGLQWLALTTAAPTDAGSA